MKNYFRDSGLVFSVIALLIVSVAMLIFSYTASIKGICIFAPLLVLAAGFTAAKLISATQKNFQYFARIDEEIEQLERVSLYDIPLSVTIVDNTNKIVWFNNEFARCFEEEAVYGSSIEVITKLSFDKLIGKEGYEIKYKNCYYRVYATVPQEKDAKEVYMIYFADITKLRILEIEKRMSQPVVMLFVIDSYEELFGGSTESETANVTVQIDKLLEDFVNGTSGILKKHSKDRFWAVVEEKHIRVLIEEKVKILDQVREIAAKEGSVVVPVCAAVEADIIALNEKAEEVRHALCALIEKDAEVFEPLSRAYSIPKDDPTRDEVMAKVLKEASLVPLEIMRNCCKALDLISEYAQKGSVIAISDAGCAAAMCKAALESAALNVYINTKSMKDRELAESMNAEVQEMMDKYCQMASEVYASVAGRLH